MNQEMPIFGVFQTQKDGISKRSQDHMLNNILNIWQKEIMDVLRDRKGLRQMLLIPLFLGFFYALFNPLLGSLAESRRETQLTIPVQGLENAGDDLTGFFAERDIRLEPFVGDMEAAISRGEEPVGLIFPASFAEQVASGEAATLILRTNNTAGGLLNRGSSLARLELVLSQYNQRISIARLEAANVDSSVLAPITLDAQDLATAAQRAVELKTVPAQKNKTIGVMTDNISSPASETPIKASIVVCAIRSRPAASPSTM